MMTAKKTVLAGKRTLGMALVLALFATSALAVDDPDALAEEKVF